jgi:hypothetical protein
MTPEQRQNDFDTLFDALPGSNIERIRKVCAVLHCDENTVRIWRGKTNGGLGHRVIPTAKLLILRDRMSPVKKPK